jgi:hypothetical protein
MVERVRITPFEMIVRRANGSEAFNTGNRYIKTDAYGNMRLNRQLSSVYFYTENDVVTAPQIQGALIHNFPFSSVASGGQTSVIYPEFTGKLSVVVSGFNELGGPPSGAASPGLKVIKNGTLVTEVRFAFLFSQQGGGGVAVRPAAVEVPGDFSPGDTVTFGGVSVYHTSSGALIQTDSSGFPGSEAVRFAAFAYESASVSVPLSVTV